MKHAPIASQLPITLPNGQQIRYFAKHCPRCRHKVEAADMIGRAQRVEDRVLLAARAVCPACQHRFNVACVIDQEKHVTKLWIPTGFLLWWLKDQPAPEPVATTPPPEPPAALPADLQISEETVGQFAGQPIPAWIITGGQRYVFDHVALGQTAAANERIVNGLIFREAKD